MSMGLSKLAAAKAALQYVQVVLPLGSGNNFKDGRNPILRAFVEVKLVTDVRPAMLREDIAMILTSKLYRAFGAEFGEAERAAYITRVASIAVAAGCGNCSDQATVAFCYLYYQHIRPIDLMYLTNEKHSFVVIGKNSDGGLDPATWGEDVVVCDPWNDDAYTLAPAQAASTLLVKMQCNCSQAKTFCRFG